MEILKVYEISDEITERTELNEQQISNINDIFDVILSEGNIKKRSIKFEVSDESQNDKTHPIVKYNKVVGKRRINEKNLETTINYFSEELLDAEMITVEVKSENEDGSIEKHSQIRRNATIKQGLLFIKHTDEILILMKLEEAKMIDTETFEKIDGVSLENEYYKCCIFRPNEIKNIDILDKNDKISKYWTKRFLKLERSKDDYTNTKCAIQSILEDKIFNFDLEDEKEKEALKNQAIQYITTNSVFSKVGLFNSLELEAYAELSSENYLKKDIEEELDDDFSVSKKAVNEIFKKTIAISNTMKLQVDNFIGEKTEENITLNDNALMIKVDSEYLVEIENIFS